MLSLISTIMGLLVSGLPKLLEFFQDRADKAHEMNLMRLQSERELALAAQGFAAQARMEEIRTEQVMMETTAEMTKAALKHDEKVLDRAHKWVASYVGTVRPTVTYIFVLELVGINVWLCYFLWSNPQLINLALPLCISLNSSSAFSNDNTHFLSPSLDHKISILSAALFSASTCMRCAM